MMRKLLTAGLALLLCLQSLPSRAEMAGSTGAVNLAPGGTVTANQGTPAATANAWPTTLAIAGALNAVGNPIFVAPGTGITWVLGAGSALVGNFGVGQASTTSGQSGPLGQCAVTTSAPTYTTAQTDPLSCDTAGNLRVGGGVAQGLATAGQSASLVMGAVTTSAPTYSTSNSNPLSLDTAGNLRVVFAADAAGGAAYRHIAAGQATTVIKSGAGTLYAITLNGAATATNVTTVYDNTAGSGAVILIPAATTATIPTTLTFGPAGIAFATGLTVVTGTANGADMTFVYQ